MATAEARRDLVVGGLWLLTLPVGWVLNLGHRLDVVRRLHEGQSPCFTGFAPYPRTFARGAKAALAIGLYLAPSLALALACAAGAPERPWWQPTWTPGWIVAGVAFAIGVFALPGGMTVYAALGDPSYLYRPDRAIGRALAGGQRYLAAWAIGLAAIALSFLGLAALGVGFFFTSVWAWQVVGYAFSRALVLERVRR